MKRHALSTRLWHWLNLLCVVVLFMSGLTISNAHRRLYWGDWGFEASQAWLMVPRFPDWMTIPGYYSLAVARDWHILMAWPFALGLLFMWIAMMVNRHFKRDIVTKRREWRPSAIWRDVVEHLKLNFDHHEGKYNFLQKLAYGLVLGVFLPMMIFTGISISPGMEPTFGWLVDLLGGRQSARSLHFIFAFAIAGFFIVHVLLVILSGPIGQMRDMITGGRKA
ncbi:MAG: cytochrome b/b6 domain-containing protein [Pseudomonadota bacterium]|jgi:thiosulfate reductase cytochrome b subunit|uniref:cytochrome b/b6 domain-containing protein n=1 Tax=Qipengyuania pacifica TaxID=2860199 RepID=UPI002E8D5880|nr:cytochrome b/b6 domain-containing protein [Erythrobacter sp.]MEE2795019.1 cytochrome b/b6 domain-containing protein [Pseudomonadota bacterium]